MTLLGGIRIIEDRTLVDIVEDWSQVRSPSRARRRRKRGFPQRIRIFKVPKPDAFSIDGGRTLVMHPETAKKLRSMVATEDNRPMYMTQRGTT